MTDVVAARRPSWIDDVKARGVESVARTLGVTVHRDALACPACGAEQRGSSDRRGAAGVTGDGAGWRCHRCAAGGTALDLAMWHVLHRPAHGAADWDRVRAACTCEAPAPTPATRRTTAPHDGAWAADEARCTWEAHVDAQLAPCLTCPACLAGEGDPYDGQPCSGRRAANPARAWLSTARGFPADARLESGAATATLATLDAWPAHGRGWVRRTLRSPALLAPLRNARTNLVEALALRYLAATTTPKCVTVAGLRHTAPDATPRGYGWAGACLRADLVVLVEGLTDTLAAEALLWTCPGEKYRAWVAIGAIAAGSLDRWAPILSERRHGHVVVVPDLDRPKGATLPTATGTGQDAAATLVRALRAAGTGASIFRPGSMLKRLRAAGLPLDDALPRIKDLADTVRECAAANIPWDTLRAAFHDTLVEVTT